MEHDVTKKRPLRVNPVNIPNALTLLRIILVPIFLYLLFVDSQSAAWWALGIFVVAGLSDFFDGEIARRWNIITDFGKIADPIADKALTLGAFVVLSITSPQMMPWIATILIAIRELGITWWRGVLLKQGIVVPANWGGKVKTVLQLFAIFLMIMPWKYFTTESFQNTMGWVILVTVILTVAVTVYTGLEYVVQGQKQRKTA